MKTPRVKSDRLKEAALRQMDAVGMPLQEVATGSRAMIYKTKDNKTVRLRTTNDPILVVVAQSADPDAKLNIEGTDYLLVVMPKEPRSEGPIESYLVPTEVATSAAKSAHKQWLETKPNTKNDNKTRNIWFRDNGKTQASSDFAKKWHKYLIDTPGSTLDATTKDSEPTEKDDLFKPLLPDTVTGLTGQTVAEVVDAAIQRISSLTGVPKEMIKIEVKISG